MTDNKHTPGELYLSEAGTIGEFTIVIRPTPKHGGDIIAEAPEGWQDSMSNWRANANRIVKTWNEYDQLKAENEALKERVKELEDGAIIDMAFNPLKAELEAAKGILKTVRFWFGNEANYPEGTGGYKIVQEINALLNQ